MKLIKKGIIVFILISCLFIIGCSNQITGDVIGVNEEVVEEDYICEDCNVILLLIDTLRADHMGCYGYYRETTPEIDKFAKESVIFKNMIAQCSWTRPSTTSILSGLYLKNHGVYAINQTLSEDVLILPEILQDNGYHTYAFISNGIVSEHAGFNQGYDHFNDRLFARLMKERREQNNLSADPNGAVFYINSKNLNEEVFEFVRENVTSRFNNFIYIHYMDPHGPYNPEVKHFSADNKIQLGNDTRRLLGPKNVSQAFLEEKTEKERQQIFQEMINSYDDEILINDDSVGELFEFLKSQGMYDNSIIIILADHGEEFYEHGGFAHGRTLYEEQLKVPLIIKVPNIGHKVIDEQVNHIDVVPTVLDLLGIDSGVEFDGVNVLDGKYHEFSYSELEFHKNKKSAIRTLELKLIRNHLDEKDNQFYLLSEDYKEKNDLYSNKEYSIEVELLYNRLNSFLEDKRDLDLTQQEREIDEETLEQLKALGYMN